MKTNKAPESFPACVLAHGGQPYFVKADGTVHRLLLGARVRDPDLIERGHTFARQIADRTAAAPVPDPNDLVTADAPRLRVVDAAEVFNPQWPAELTEEDARGRFCLLSDDDSGTWLEMIILSEDPAAIRISVKNRGLESLSVRFHAAVVGGRLARVRQALLWLAVAMKLDAPPKEG